MPTPSSPTPDASSSSPTEYATRSLDDLRTLSASVDTPRIDSLHQNFDSVATHLDHVATSLSRLRNDLPTWWQGPAADAAVARLSTAIAHSHQAQDTAHYASIALRTCAQVVAAEQEAMDRIPEIPDPQTEPQALPPKSPTTAAAWTAEMATKQRAYSTAQAEAARRVGGIAAQFVETTAQLKAISAMEDEGFTTLPNGRVDGSRPGIGPSFKSPVPQEMAIASSTSPGIEYLPQQPYYDSDALKTQYDLAGEKPNTHTASNERTSPISPIRHPSHLGLNETSQSASRAFEEIQNLAIGVNGKGAASKRPKNGSIAGSRGSSLPDTAPAPSGSKKAFKSSADQAPADQASAIPPEASAPNPRSSLTKPDLQQVAQLNGHSRNINRALPQTNFFDIADQHPTSMQSAETSEQRHNLGVSNPSASEGPLGFPSVSPGRRAVNRGRGQRPRYLTEPTDTWLAEVVAAPPGGILTSNWEP